MNTLERLDQMVVNAKRIDGVGERADRAADLYLAGKVRLVCVRRGEDEWQADSGAAEKYIVSVARKSCNCFDTSAPRPALGKLCRHRLAAMFAAKLRTESLAEIGVLLANSHAASGVIKVALYYGEYPMMFVDGFRISGHFAIDLEHPQSGGLGWHRFQVVDEYMADALAKVGWGVTANVKQKGLRHNWLIAPGVDRATSLAALRGVAVNVTEERQQRKRFEEIEAVADLVMV